MGNDILTVARRNLRGIDIHSLLCLYDLATEAFNKDPSQQEQPRADRAVQRIAKELHTRKLTSSAKPTNKAPLRECSAEAGPESKTEEA